MKDVISKLVIILFVLIINSCEDEINNTSNNPIVLYKLEGNISVNAYPAPYLEVFFDTLKCRTDSMGYFIFDSLKSQTSRLLIVHPKAITIDTMITINKNLDLKFDLDYKSNLFFPLSIGNKWFYSMNTSIENSIKWEVTREITLNNHNYFVIEKSKFDGTPLDTIYYRFEGDKLIELFIGSSQSNYYLESTFADFSITEQDTFEYYLNLYIDDKDYYYFSTLYNNPYNKSAEEITFYYHLYSITDIDFRSTFHIGIGLTKLIRLRGPSEFLIAYYIN